MNYRLYSALHLYQGWKLKLWIFDGSRIIISSIIAVSKNQKKRMKNGGNTCLLC